MVMRMTRRRLLVRDSMVAVTGGVMFTDTADLTEACMVKSSEPRRPGTE